ncbi:hypothetical protein ABPG77_009580 [Micractinium sp. CCAP 211/92]
MGACWGRPLTEQEAGGAKIVPHEPPVGTQWVAGEKVHGNQAFAALEPGAGAGAATPHSLAPATVAAPAAPAISTEENEAGGETDTSTSDSLPPGQAGYWAAGGGAPHYHSAYSADEERTPSGGQFSSFHGAASRAAGTEESVGPSVHSSLP